jgi:hypothetical protein
LGRVYCLQKTWTGSHDRQAERRASFVLDPLNLIRIMPA